MSSPPESQSSAQLLVSEFTLSTLSRDAISAEWSWSKPLTIGDRFAFAQLFYMLETDQTMQKSPRFESPGITEYTLRELASDSSYHVCLRVQQLQNYTERLESVAAGSVTAVSTEERICRHGSTNLFHMSASIGSSVGAFLALAIIVVFVVASQIAYSKKKKRNRKGRRRSSSQDNGGGVGSTKRHRRDSNLDQFYEPADLPQSPPAGTCLYFDQTLIVPLGAEGGGTVSVPEGTFQCSCGYVHVLQSDDLEMAETANHYSTSDVYIPNDNSQSDLLLIEKKPNDDDDDDDYQQTTIPAANQLLPVGEENRFEEAAKTSAGLVHALHSAAAPGDAECRHGALQTSAISLIKTDANFS